MHINIQNKYDLYIETGGMDESYIQTMADDIGNRLVAGLGGMDESYIQTMADDIGNRLVAGLGRSNIPVEELVQFYIDLENYVIDQNYNTYISDQIIIQLADQFDSEFQQLFNENEVNVLLEERLEGFQPGEYDHRMTIH